MAVRALAVRVDGVGVAVVGVVMLFRDHLGQHRFHVRDEMRLRLVDTDGRGGVLGKDNGEAVSQTGGQDCVFHPIRDVDKLRPPLSPDRKRLRKELHAGCLLLGRDGRQWGEWS